MPTCQRLSFLGGTRGDLEYVNETQAAYPQVYAKVWVADTVTTDLSKCAAVSVSGADYQSLLGRLSALEARPSGGSTGEVNDVNVTADIFVGAALVLCLALGWIAGGQR